MPTRKPLPDWAHGLVELAKMQAGSICDKTRAAALNPADRLNVLEAFGESKALLTTLDLLVESNGDGNNTAESERD